MYTYMQAALLFKANIVLFLEYFWIVKPVSSADHNVWFPLLIKWSAAMERRM